MRLRREREDPEGQRERTLGAGREETEAEMRLCIKKTEANRRESRSAERAVASHRDGIEDQRGSLGG